MCIRDRRYVNKVLENWYEEAKARGLDVNQKTTVTQAVLNQYYEFLRRQAEETAQAHKREIYKILPRAAEIDAMHRELGSKLTKDVYKRQAFHRFRDLLRLRGMQAGKRNRRCRYGWGISWRTAGNPFTG